MTSPMPSSAASPRVLDKKREILGAASRVFRRRGIRGTGMREIATEAGMTVGNLYYYFENKQALLAFCQQQGLDGLLALARDPAIRSLPADRALYELIVGHVEQLNEGTPGSLAHLEVEGLEDPFRSALLGQRAEYEATLQRLIERGVTEGLFGPTDAAVATRAILGAMNWTVRWFRPEGRKSARQIGEDCAALLVRGLLATGVEQSFGIAAAATQGH